MGAQPPSFNKQSVKLQPHVINCARFTRDVPIFKSIKKFRTFFILDTVTLAIVKTQRKCGISSGSALFADIKTSSRTKIHHLIKIKVDQRLLKYIIDKSILIVSILMVDSIIMKRV